MHMQMHGATQSAVCQVSQQIAILIIDQNLIGARQTDKELPLWTERQPCWFFLIRQSETTGWLALMIELHYAMIALIGHKKTIAPHGQTGGPVELTGTGSTLTPAGLSATTGIKDPDAILLIVSDIKLAPMVEDSQGTPEPVPEGARKVTNKLTFGIELHDST